MYVIGWEKRVRRSLCCLFFFFNDTATTEIYTLSLHDALPICQKIIDFAKLIHRADDATFRAKIGSLLAVDEFLRYVAVNSALINFDSFLSTGHNYYLYVNPADGRIHFIPWDTNMSFGGYGWLGTDEEMAETSITRSYADHNILIERLLDIDEYARAYSSMARRRSIRILWSA